MRAYRVLRHDGLTRSFLVIEVTTFGGAHLGESTRAVATCEREDDAARIARQFTAEAERGGAA